MWNKTKELARRLADPIRQFGQEWSKDHASLLAAGVAFFAIFSLAPLLGLLLYIGSLFIGTEAAQQQLVDSTARLASQRTAVAMEKLIENVQQDITSGVSLFSAALLLLSASAVFRHLRTGLDLVMDVPPSERPGWLRYLVSRAIGAAMAVAIILVIAASTAITAILGSIHRLLPALVIGDLAVWRAIDFAASTTLLAILFAVTLKYVPDVKLKWRHIAWGAVPAALVFSAGRFALALFLSRSSMASSYGGAASLAVVLVATYFAILVLFAAAEVTELVARHDQDFIVERDRKRQEATGTSAST